MMRVTSRPLLLLLLTLLASNYITGASVDDITLQDIVAKEQAWAKRALERRGHSIAGGSDYLKDILNMDHHIAEYTKQHKESTAAEADKNQPTNLRSQTVVESLDTSLMGLR
mmetsp:Transcript_16993/g.37130  ORF Transcript_16993/g.37130 Transcript_16993/m.37130 type:complete len:112 (+) Transcript_16993:164-499(+)